MLTADPADAVVGLTRQLVAFDSVNPGLVPGAVGEGPVARYVADRLSGCGFEVRLVPAPADPRRMSVIAVRDGRQPGAHRGAERAPGHRGRRRDGRAVRRQDRR